jgi:hypothetical protein
VRHRSTSRAVRANNTQELALNMCAEICGKHENSPVIGNRQFWEYPAYHDDGAIRRSPTMANDLIGAIRQQRTFVVGDLEKMPWLPKRATVDEFKEKEYGMVNLVHTQYNGVNPWIRRGFYRLIRHKRLYVVEIGPNTTRGQSQSAWLYEPVVRVPSCRIAKAPGDRIRQAC